MRGGDNLPADITVRGGGTVYEFFSLVRNVRPMLPLVKLHTLIFHPRHDDQSDIKNTMALQRKLGGLVEVSVSGRQLPSRDARPSAWVCR